MRNFTKKTRRETKEQRKKAEGQVSIFFFVSAFAMSAHNTNLSHLSLLRNLMSGSSVFAMSKIKTAEPYVHMHRELNVSTTQSQIVLEQTQLR